MTNLPTWSLRCPHCQARLTCRRDPQNQTVRCPRCGHRWRVGRLALGVDQPTLASGMGPMAGVCPALGSPSQATKAAAACDDGEPPSTGPTVASAARPSSAPLPAQSLLVGQTLEVYRLDRLLGRGSFGEVYQAHDTLLARDVAIKVLSPAVASSPDVVGQFLVEARAAATVRHPNLVTVYQVGRQGPVTFIAMELVHGRDCASWVKTHGVMSVAHASDVIAQAATGLAAAHARGIVHRDIKPANLMIEAASGRVKVADFGLALRLGPTAGPSVGEDAVAGTPNYMSPEQCRGLAVDSRSDIYALGATYFALLVGRSPFVSPDPLAILEMHCHAALPDVRQFRSELPAACAAVIQRAMAKLPSQRHSCAAELVAELDALRRSVAPP